MSLLILLRTSAGLAVGRRQLVNPNSPRQYLLSPIFDSDIPTVYKNSRDHRVDKKRHVSQSDQNTDSQNNDYAIESALNLIEDVVNSLAKMRRNKRVHAPLRHRQRAMPVGGNLLHQLDVLETVMIRQRKERKKAKIRGIRQKLLSMG